MLVVLLPYGQQWSYCNLSWDILVVEWNLHHMESRMHIQFFCSDSGSSCLKSALSFRLRFTINWPCHKRNWIALIYLQLLLQNYCFGRASCCFFSFISYGLERALWIHVNCIQTPTTGAVRFVVWLQKTSMVKTSSVSWSHGMGGELQGGESAAVTLLMQTAAGGINRSVIF